MSLSALAARVRRDEYTGTNRCLPCTVVNLVIAAAVVGLVAWTGYPRLAAVVTVACLAAISLRGYLVPGTPTLTRRYAPEWFLRPFGKDDESARRGRGASTVTGGLADALFDAGVLVYGGDDDPHLDPRFGETWRERVEVVRVEEVGTEDVAAMLEAEECRAQSAVSFVVDGNALLRWESEAALAADVAAAGVLEARLEGWSDLDRSDRLDLLAGLRLFLDRCPACDGPVSRTEERVDPCCQPAYTVVRSTCEACGATVGDVSVPGAVEGTPLRLQFVAS